MTNQTYKQIRQDWENYILYRFKKAKEDGETQQQVARSIASQIADAQRHADNDNGEKMSPIKSLFDDY